MPRRRRRRRSSVPRPTPPPPDGLTAKSKAALAFLLSLALFGLTVLLLALRVPDLVAEIVVVAAIYAAITGGSQLSQARHAVPRQSRRPAVTPAPAPRPAVTPAPSPPPALTAAPASEPEGDYLTYPIPPAEAEPEAVPSKWRLYRRPNDKSRSAKSRRDLR